MSWETVIGLEVHIQLNTESKIFSGSATSFGQEPNVHASAVDLALPGTLPVLNEQAVIMAVQFGLAIDAPINPHSIFERKNYFYPDLPKGYQTSQMDEPIVGPGTLTIELESVTRSIRIHHAHLEEDAGKSLHKDYQGFTGIDLNRAGTPLLEIVSEPDMRSSAEAVAYLKKMHSIVTYLGISDGDMSQGSMRCDANVSVRPVGQQELGTRAELKNINSFRFIERAIEIEAERQIDLIEAGGKVVQETRLYDEDKDETRPMRSKEVANDYRYFPCPDLLPVVVEPELIEQLRNDLPELPDAKRERFQSQYGLSEYDAQVLTQERAIAEYFEQVATTGGDAKLASNWVTVELQGQLNKADLKIQDSPIPAEQIGKLIARIKENIISGKIAKQIFTTLWESGGDVDQIIADQGLEQVSDSSALEAMVEEVLASNAEQLDNYRQAPEDRRPKMLGFFVGQVMKISRGQANPAEVNRILKQKLGE